MVSMGRNIFFAKQNFFFQKWFTTLLLSLEDSQTVLSYFLACVVQKLCHLVWKKISNKRLFWVRCFSDKQANLSLGKMLIGCCWLKKHKHLANKWPKDQNNISLMLWEEMVKKQNQEKVLPRVRSVL